MKKHQSKSSYLEFDNITPVNTNTRAWILWLLIAAAVLALCVPVLVMIAEKW